MGQRLKIEVSLGEGRTASIRELELPSAGACEGRVSELACWLVLLEEGREVERIPIVVRAGETARVRR